MPTKAELETENEQLKRRVAELEAGDTETVDCDLLCNCGVAYACRSEGGWCSIDVVDGQEIQTTCECPDHPELTPPERVLN